MFFNNINKKEGKMPLQATQTIQKTSPAVDNLGQAQQGQEVPVKKSKLWMWILIAVGVLVVLGLIYYFFIL